MGIRDKFLYVARSITVEPVALFYFYAVGIFFLISSLAIYNTVCYQNFHNDVSVHCANLKATPDAEDKVQSGAAFWNMITILACATTAAVAGLCLGAWGDRAGRQINIILSAAATILLQFATSLYLVWPQLNLWILVGVWAIWGMTGFIPSLVLSSGAFIADTTVDPTMITVKFTNFFVMVSLGGVLSYATTYFLSNTLSLNYLNLIGMILGAAAFFYAVIRVPQVPPHIMKKRSYLAAGKDPSGNFKDERPKESVFIEVFMLLRDCFVCMFRRRPGYNRAFFITCVLVNCIYFIADIPVAMLVSLFVFRRPLEWRANRTSLYFLLWNGLQGIGRIITAMIFKKVLHIRDTTLIILSFTSIIAYMIMVAFSTTALIMYLTCVVGMFMGLALPVIKSFSAKFVSPNEVGTLFGLFGVGQNVAFIASSGFSSLYGETAAYFPGLTFLIVAGLVCVIWVVFVVVHFAEVKQEKMSNRDTELLTVPKLK